MSHRQLTRLPVSSYSSLGSGEERPNSYRSRLGRLHMTGLNESCKSRPGLVRYISKATQEASFKPGIASSPTVSDLRVNRIIEVRPIGRGGPSLIATVTSCEQEGPCYGKQEHAVGLKSRLSGYPED